MLTWILYIMQACQNTGAVYGIGSLSTVFCNTSEIEPSMNKWNIKLSYTGGADTRQSEFTFMYSPKDATPEMTFDKEQPELHYVSCTHRRIDTYVHEGISENGKFVKCIGHKKFETYSQYL